MTGSATVVVIASAMIDMISYVERVPTAGETLRGEHFRLGFGGKGANQAVMVGRAGARVHLTACLGDDVFGDMSLAHYAAMGFDLSGVRRIAGASSGVAPIWVEATGENRIIVNAGANDHLDAEQAIAAVRGPEQLAAVLCQMEVPQAATLAAFGAARERGAVTVLNPAPAQRPVDGLLDLCDWVIVNETEFDELLAGTRTGAAPSEEAMLRAAAGLRGALVVTLGSRGAAVIQDGRVEVVRTDPVEAVDTTGAGDAFVGTFTAVIAAGGDPVTAARGAVACASHSVTAHGTQASYPTVAETAALLGRATGR
jgi:ribokinase